MLGLVAITQRRSIVVDDPASAPQFADLYARHGYRTIHFVPLLFRDEAMGLLVLYHCTPYDWSPDEQELVRVWLDQAGRARAQRLGAVRFVPLVGEQGWQA